MVQQSAFATVILALLPLSVLAGELPSPQNVPVPELRPDTSTAPKDEKPETKPSADAVTKQQDTKDPTPTGDQPTPLQEKPKDEPENEASTPPPSPPAKEDPAAYASCLSALKETGISFSEEPGFDDGDGCGIDKPLAVREVLPGIKLEPEAKMRCEAALQLSRWAKGNVLPAAEIAFGQSKTIVSFHQATSYACRNRDSAETGKLSEHARGNAIDISGFSFSDKSKLDIAPREKDGTMTGAFQRSIIATGCLYFSTVLGPESDGFHKTHIHLDVIKRKADYRYCW